MRLQYLFASWLLFAPAAFAGHQVGETDTYGREVGFTQLLYYVPSGNGAGQVEYICTAYPGAATSEAKWQIRKLTYNSSNVVTAVEWAGGNDNYDKICDNRASLTYE